MPNKRKQSKKDIHVNKYKSGAIENTVLGNNIMCAKIAFIKSILIKEGCKKSPFTTQKALYLDEVEVELSRKEKRKKNNTVDFVVGLCHKFTLLVEAKLRAEKPENFYRELDNKIRYSQALMKGQPNFCHFEVDTVILLNEDRFEQNKNKLMRLVGNKPFIRPLRVLDFYESYFVK